jgi:hypothetical protein
LEEDDFYATIEEMVLDAWVLPTAVELKIPVAIAKSRKMQAQGCELVTRGRTTTTMENHLYLFPTMSSLRRASPWSRIQSFGNLRKEDLTYSDYRDMAFAWQKYTEKKHPSSRELASVMTGHPTNINAKSSQLRFFCRPLWLSS